ncbi:MAG: hypothetical protein NT141_01270 [candidate division WWE3 bacterium]|nr:hypothetical protein [candidate division WWE3 bacterium]
MDSYYERRSPRLHKFDYSSENMYFVTICNYQRNCTFGRIINNNVGAGHAPSDSNVGAGFIPPSDDRTEGRINATPTLINEFSDILTLDSPGEMLFNDWGLIVKQTWEELPKYFPKITLYDFNIMPNHIHGLIQIEGSIGENYRKYQEQIKTFDTKLINSVENSSEETNEKTNVGEEHDINSINVGEGHAPPSIQSADGEACLAPTFTLGEGVAPKLMTIIGSFKSAVSKQIHETSSYQGQIWQRSFYDHIIWDDDDYKRIAGYIKFNPKVWDRDRNNPIRIKT